MLRCVRHEWLQRRAGVLRERNFRRFYAGYVTSLLGSSMSAVAIAWAVLENGEGRPASGSCSRPGSCPRW